MSLVLIAGYSNEEVACIYGTDGGLRIAKYYNQNGQAIYGTSFSSDSKFYEIRGMCVEAEYCVYSQSTDTAVLYEPRGDGTYSGMYLDNFSRKLVKHTDDNGAYYTLNQEDSVPISAYSTLRAAALSPNGEWSAIEVAGSGLVRLDMRTGLYRWIAMQGIGDGSYSEDAPNLAVSNDGQSVAITGWYQGVGVYSIDETCGYEGVRPQNVSWCPVQNIDQQLLPGFIYGYSPRFTGDGKRLSFVVEGAQGLRKEYFAPTGYGFPVNPKYLAFGDSFTSGEGELNDSFYIEGTNTQSNRCHVSNRSYPYLLSSYWEIVATNHACSGSRIPDVRAKSAIVLAEISASPSVMSLGIGGNDIDLVGKMKSCLGPGTCEWAKPGNRAATTSEMKRLLPSLISLISDLQSNTVAPMFLVGYPLVINPADTARCDLLIGNLLSKEERQYIDESIRYLNRTLETAAQFTDVSYINAQDAFQGERLCDTQESSMNGIRTGGDIAPIPFLQAYKVIGSESFHPTPRGHKRISEILIDKLGGLWEAPSCTGCIADTHVTDYWTAGATLAQLFVTRFAFDFIETNQTLAGEVVPVEFPEGTFSPNSTIKIEIHSEPKELLVTSAATDGSLNTEITLPKEFGGYHSVHAYGTSVSGEDLDIYQTIFVEPDPNAQKNASISHSLERQGVAPSQLQGARLKIAPSSATSFNIPAVLGLVSQNSQSKIPTASNDSNVQQNFGFVVYIVLASTGLLIIGILLFARRV